MNYVVLIVGYGVDDNVLYWIIKNFWGYFWGDDGYIKIVMNYDRCGLMNGFLLVIKKDLLIVEFLLKILNKVFR